MPSAPPRSHAALQLEVVVRRGDVTARPADLVVVHAYEGVERLRGVAAAVDASCGGALARVVAAGDFRGKLKEMALVHPAEGPFRRVLLVGLGKVDQFSPDRARRASAVAARRARDLGVETCTTVLPGVGSGGLSPAVSAEALAEGALLGLYVFEDYKSKRDEEPPRRLKRIVVVERDAARAREAREGARVGSVVAACTNLARDWQQWSGDDAAPARYGERARALSRAEGLRAVVMDKRAIEKAGMGGLLAVSQGSAREPRFVVLEHAPPGARHTLVLVGKGITFDSGGISIKPAQGMENMKMDKSGAAAVVGAVLAAKRLGLPLRVVALAPFADNMPSGSSYKPGDVVRTMSGKTIEVVNTDAEGRVVLADALHYADRYRPDACVELSTLTGACAIAVGHHAIAAMGTNEALLAQLRAAGEAVRERVWPLPFFDEYGEMVQSKVADVKNSAGRVAGTITAGKFLAHFVGDWPWVHLDIAATAYHDGATPRFNDEYSPGQATGVGVRLLVRWMRDFTPLGKTGAAARKAPRKTPRRG